MGRRTPMVPNEPDHPYYWRPWETRPREDTYILVRWADGERSVIHREWTEWEPDDPTHWMPLPPEPSDG